MTDKFDGQFENALDEVKEEKEGDEALETAEAIMSGEFAKPPSLEGFEDVAKELMEFVKSDELKAILIEKGVWEKIEQEYKKEKQEGESETGDFRNMVLSIHESFPFHDFVQIAAEYLVRKKFSSDIDSAKKVVGEFIEHYFTDLHEGER